MYLLMIIAERPKFLVNNARHESRRWSFNGILYHITDGLRISSRSFSFSFSEFLGRFVDTACNTVEVSPSCNTLYVYFCSLQALHSLFSDTG